MTAKARRFRIGTDTKTVVPKKHLGQNFLIDLNIQRKIIDFCDLKPHETVLEIGPGLGVLTGEIAARVKQVIAIEADAALAEDLKKTFQAGNVEVIHADFLKYPLNRFPKGLKVIGNLPYYISTPILERIIAHPEHFESLYATLQYELGQRLQAVPGTKAYGAFTCFVRYHMDTEILFKIKNVSFKPAPKVHSCFLKFTRKPLGKLAPSVEKILFQVIQGAFRQRRKTIVNALSAARPQEEIRRVLAQTGINPQSRAENLTLEDYMRIAEGVTEKERAKGNSSLHTNA